MNLRTVRDGARARLPVAALLVPLLLACCALVGLDAWRALDARSDLIAADNAQTATLARSLAQHAHDTMQSIDAAVLAVREAVETDAEGAKGEAGGAEGLSPAARGRLVRLMQLQGQALPSIHALLVLDTQGHLVADTIAAPHAGLDASDRPYFRFHRDHPGRGVRIGEMMRARVDGSWVITVSRRLDGPDGRFAGVAMGTMAVDSLQRFYGSLDAGGHGSIVLMAADGLVLAVTPSDPAQVGTSVAAGNFFSRVLPRASFGSAAFLCVLDGLPRIGSYERVEGFPLVVLVSHPREDVLAAWRASTGVHLLVSLAAAALLALCGGSLAAQVRRRLAAEALLGERERHYRMLADNATDLITHTGPDMLRRYVSPACRTLLGYEPEELLGRDLLRLVVEEDRTAVEAALARLAAGGPPELLSYRARRADATVLWVEATGRRLEDGSGFLFAVRDISRRKAVERDLHAANAELKRLALLDGLTGIGNRRAFDAALEREVRAAVHSELPLSLLLIDIDHFKRLNDGHGHSVGDSCIRLVAATLGGWMRRPEDHLARFGGEEFAVLLPQTEGDGAALLAARLCAAVRGLDVAPLAGDGRISLSISVGVATLDAAADAADGQGLVDAADRALYAAKQGGRDRVAVAGAAGAEASALAG